MRIPIHQCTGNKTITKFLLIPKALYNEKGEREIRWLEKASFVRRYEKRQGSLGYYMEVADLYWANNSGWDFKPGDLVVYPHGVYASIGLIDHIEGEVAFVYYGSNKNSTRTDLGKLLPLFNENCIKEVSLGGKVPLMSVSRFRPGLYGLILAGKITSPDNLSLQTLSVKELHQRYPKYSLFMDIHLGRPFHYQTLQNNAEAIRNMAVEDLLATLGEDSDGTPMFYITTGDLQSKYGLDLREADSESGSTVRYI